MLLLITTGTGGCGGGQGLAKRELDDLKAQVVELQREQVRMHRKLEELGQWMFLIQDRVDSNRVSLSRSPKLKVVKLEPGPSRQETAISAAPVHGEADLHTDRPYNPPEPEAAQGTVSPGAGQGDATGHMKLVKGVADVRGTSPGAVEAYKRALAMLEQGDVNQAILAFSRFLKDYPDHDLADNALYWTGEAYYDQKEYALALSEFKRVIEDYPEGNKVPDALLKSALCLVELKDLVSARNTLYQLVDLYPASEAAETAQEILGRLGNSRTGGGGSHVPKNE